ncbi:MAG: twin-arginine translocase TatA/TatE family subunit [Actinomycetota bacterium]|nr:twin-arginine translocase TatA/TatE family subunit [Actinomycetota bacterium]
MFPLLNIASPEIIVVLILAVVLIFGANRLPKLARNVGEASKEFKKAQLEAEEEAKKEEAAKAAAAAAPKPALAVPSDDDKITLSKSELDALLIEREARIRREAATRDAEIPPAN